MADSTYVKREVRKRSVPPKTTGMGQGYAEAESMGVGIVPGAHPEFEKGPRLGNPVKQVGDLWKKMFPKRKK